MKYLKISVFAFFLSTGSYAAAPFTTQTNLFNQSNSVNLGLTKLPGTETYSVFKPTVSTNHFSNGVVLVGFKEKLYCMWQSSATDEDASDTWVAYSVSTNGADWSAPVVLANNAPKGIYTSGGWFVRNDSLIAYINAWPGLNPKGGHTLYKSTADGVRWSALKAVRMLNGDTLKGIFEQDPHILKNGRIVNSAHFQPGLNVAPIYTDDISGVKGWVKANYTNLSTGSNSREMEPSLFVQSDGKLVMIFRDQNSTYTKLASSSSDNGQTWSTTVQTDMPDSRSKQCAGNLPDGTAYFASNPVESKTRIPLVLTLSKDGKVFTKAFVLREGGADLQTQRYTGSAKSLGYSYPKANIWNNFLYVSYSTNKEDVEITRVPVSTVSLNAGTSVSTVQDMNRCVNWTMNRVTYFKITDTINSGTISIYNISGEKIVSEKLTNGQFEKMLNKGMYIVRVTTSAYSVSKKFEVQ